MSNLEAQFKFKLKAVMLNSLPMYVSSDGRPDIYIFDDNDLIKFVDKFYEEFLNMAIKLFNENMEKKNKGN